MTTDFLTLAPYVTLLGPFIIVTAWLRLRQDAANRPAFLRIWLITVFAQVGLGWLAGHLDPEATRRGLALLFSGTSWLLGPCLAPLVGRGPAVGGLALGAVISPLGGVLSLVAGLAFGVLNPCG